MESGWRGKARKLIREYPRTRAEPVQLACEVFSERGEHGKIVIEFIRRMYWQKKAQGKIEPAAAEMCLSYSLGQIYHAEFLSIVDAFTRRGEGAAGSVNYAEEGGG